MSGTATSSAAHASSSAAASAVSHPAKFNQSNFLFNVDVFLLCIIALFFLLALPSAVARFSHVAQWTEGMFFRRIASPAQSRLSRSFSSSSRAKLSPVDFTPIEPALRIAVNLTPLNQDDAEKAGMSEESLAMRSQADLVRHCSNKRLPAVQPQNPPTHMPAWSSMLPLAHRVLAYPVRPGYSVGKTLLLLAYTGVMLYAGLHDSNPFTDPARAGYVAASQVPFLVIMATKNNVIGWLVGCGYEKLNFLHRFMGRFVVLAINVHAIGYMYSWTAEGSFSTHLKIPSHAWGFVGLIAVDVLFVLSTSIVRQICYPVFYVSHVLMAMLSLGAFCAHESWAVPYVIIAVVFYAFDRVLRVVRSRYTMANLHALPELAMTRIEVPTVNAGWRAGQHVRIKVLSMGMGWLGWAETHPFTIASVSRGPGDEGLVLMCKKAGDWTEKLFELATRADYGEVNGLGRSVRVVIDGPYGGPGHAVLPSYSGAMFVAGGSGITYVLASVRDLMYRAAQGQTRVKAIDLVWSIPDPASLTPLVPLFTSLLAESEYSYTRLRISVSYTRAPASPEAFAGVHALPAGLTLSPGRPRLGKILESVVDRTYGGGRSSAGALTGIVAGVCGPPALGAELVRAVRGVPAARAKAVGGIEIHEEIFGW